MHPSRKHQRNPEYSQQPGFVALASLIPSFLLQIVSVPTPTTLSTCDIWLPWKHYATSNGIFFKVEIMTRHAVDDPLEVSLLGALWADEGAKWRATFSCHGVKIWVGADK